MRKATALSVIIGALLLLGAGCGDDDDGDATFNDALNSRLRACGLITDGQYLSATGETDDPESNCFFDCILSLDCDDLTYQWCDVGTDSGAYLACLDNCHAQYGVECADGSGYISSYWVCNGWDECADGSDEVDCTYFDCADGQQSIGMGFVCDGYEDCWDGSDEEGSCPLPEQYICDDGSTIDFLGLCDDFEDCPDGSDEVDCATRTCPQ